MSTEHILAKYACAEHTSIYYISDVCLLAEHIFYNLLIANCLALLVEDDTVCRKQCPLLSLITRYGIFTKLA